MYKQKHHMKAVANSDKALGFGYCTLLNRNDLVDLNSCYWHVIDRSMSKMLL